MSDEAEGIKREIVETIDATLQEKQQEILLLKSVHTWFDLFFGKLAEMEPHLPSITRDRVKGIQPEVAEEQQAILRMIRQRRIIEYLRGYLNEEYKGFRFEMLCGNYEGALRTLRWILETSVYAVEFQMDKPTASIYRDMLANPPKSITERIDPTFEFKLTISEFQERLDVMEKYGRPKLKEILSKISILRNAREWKKNDPSIDRDDLRSMIRGLYSDLSKYVHYSKETTIHSPRRWVAFDEGEFFVGRYNKMVFHEAYAFSVAVLDSIILLLALLDAWYFGYDTFHKYVKALEREFTALLEFIKTNEKLIPSHVFLPKTKQVIECALNVA